MLKFTKTNDADFSYNIIGAAMEVHRGIGPGIHEKPYENTLRLALRSRGYRVEPQKAWPIFYKQQVIGDCITDSLIDQNLLIEVKAVAQMGEQEEAQLLNDLRICKVKTGLLLNFKPKSLKVKRLSL